MTKLAKSLILALMVPILLAPKMSKAIFVPTQPDFDKLIVLPTRPDYSTPDEDKGITIPDDIDDGNQIDPETLIENGKNNYELGFSPNLDNGIFYFNNDDKTNLVITVDTKDDSLSSIEAVSAEIRNNVGQTVDSVEFSRQYGKFMYNLDLSDLPTENAYAVILTINSQVSVNDGSSLMDASYSFAETTNAVTLIGEEVDTSNIDDNDNDDNDDVDDNTGDINDDDNSESNTTPAITNNDEIDNYKVDFNQTTSTYNNEKRYYFRNSSDSLIVKITENDKSYDALNRIDKVIYEVHRKDNNQLVRYQNINQPNLYNNYTFALDFSLLNEREEYELSTKIIYEDTANSAHKYSRDYHILNLIPKAVSNDDDNNDNDADDDNNNNDDSDNTSDIQEGHNISYNINQNLVNYDGNEVYLYNENELVDIRIWQNSYSNDAPSIASMTLLENNSSIKNCYNSGICQFRYESPLNQTVNLTLRVNYKSPNSNHRYSRNYDLGQHLRKAEDNNDDDNDDTTNNASLSDFALIKGSTTSVYLVNQNNERYYIPDWSILKSWYNQPNIMQVNDVQVSQYELKGNMIYRPGSLIKIATDPKCYAVGLDGSLHWVYNENVARGIYGSNWNKNIYTVPDSLFPSYNFAEPVYHANDFDMPSLNEALEMYK